MRSYAQFTGISCADRGLQAGRGQSFSHWPACDSNFINYNFPRYVLLGMVYTTLQIILISNGYVLVTRLRANSIKSVNQKMNQLILTMWE